MARLPPFSCQAAVSGRPVSNEAIAGRAAVLILHGPAGADFAKEVSKAVRARVPSARKAVVASIVDLRSMAGLWRRIAEAQLRKTYDSLGARVREHLPGEEPEEHVLLCPDWDGATVAALGHPDAGSAPVALVVGPGGDLLATVAGPGAGQKAADALPP